MSFKIAFIGAGSLVFARTLFTDIISVPEFHNIEIAFTDINPDNLEKTRELCQRDLDANNIPIRIEATTNRRDAFKDARYIVNCVRIGGLEGFETDVEIPLKYGIDQCVGDTLCTCLLYTSAQSRHLQNISLHSIILLKHAIFFFFFLPENY